MGTIFSKIVNGDIPSYKIAEDEFCYAFLDINPVQIGHCLVIPKEEINYIFDVDDDLLSKMIVFSKKVAKAIELVIPCERIAVSVIGLEVPHAHIHLIPINKMSDINFYDKKSYSSKEFEILAEKIRNFITSK